MHMKAAAMAEWDFVSLLMHIHKVKLASRNSISRYKFCVKFIHANKDSNGLKYFVKHNETQLLIDQH